MKKRMLIASAVTLLSGHLLIAPVAQASPAETPVSLRSKGHLKILTGTGRPTAQGVRVFGLVRRTVFWRTGVFGHLDIDVFGPAGQRLESESVTWRGRLGGGDPARYEATFPGLTLAEISRVEVAYSPVSDGAKVTGAVR